jgi:hypothetical protein
MFLSGKQGEGPHCRYSLSIPGWLTMASINAA